jgi:hypothetical protein
MINKMSEPDAQGEVGSVSDWEFGKFLFGNGLWLSSGETEREFHVLKGNQVVVSLPIDISSNEAIGRIDTALSLNSCFGETPLLQ